MGSREGKFLERNTGTRTRTHTDTGHAHTNMHRETKIIPFLYLLFIQSWKQLIDLIISPISFERSLNAIL